MIYRSKMWDNDWDLSAVTRNYNINGPNNVVTPNLGLETFGKDDWDTFDKLLAADMTEFNSLPEISSIDIPVAYQEKSDDQVVILDQNDHQQLYINPIQPTQFSQQIFLAASPTTITCVPTITTTPQEWIGLQQQQHMMEDNVDPNLTLPMKTPLVKTYKRKNQPVRVVYEVLQEELTNDKWAWRKYGQKSLKGFPFPRNYYKCSTKLCEAKKIIEKSPKNENYFLVSYSGEHNHDPPTYRRSLIFYNSSSKYKLPRGLNIVPKALSVNTTSSSSKRAKHSKVDASSICPIAPTLKMERTNEIVNVVVENKSDGVEKEDNVNEDILIEFEELQRVIASI